MMDVDAAQALLQLTGKQPIKRLMPEMAEQEANKRQKLIISDVDTSESIKGMSLKNMLNSADELSADHSEIVSFPSQSENSFETKLENRKIIINYWSQFFPEVLRLMPQSIMISDDGVWTKTLNTFLELANQKHIRQLVTDFLLQKIRSHVSDVTQIPWKQIAKIGISGWPENLEIENVWGMSFPKLLLVVSKLDEIGFGPNFAEEFEKNRYKSGHRQNLQKSICYHVRNILTTQIGVFISNIPWKDLKNQDFINWPQDIPVVCPVNLSLDQKHKLNNVVQDVRLTDEAVERIKATMCSEIHVLRREITSKLRLKLNEQLGFPVANVPWKSLKSSDIQNWPEEVPIDYPNLLTSTQNRQVLEHLQDMKFSKDFLNQMSDSLSSNRHYQGKTSSHIAKHLREQLNLQMGSYISGVPWKDISPQDIIGWPEGVPVKHPYQLNASEKEKIIENLHSVKFTDDFLEQLKSKRVCLDIRKFVSSGLRSKLAKQLGTVVAHIPWKEMTLDDISGWPADVPMKYPNLLAASQNKKIMDNMANISFTPEFIERCKTKE